MKRGALRREIAALASGATGRRTETLCRRRIPVGTRPVAFCYG